MAETQEIGIAEPSKLANIGARISPQYVERNPAMWALGEIDVKALSLAGTVATVCFSVGSFSIGFCFNIIVSFANAEKLTPEATVLLRWGSPLLALVTVVAYAFGIYFAWRRRTLWNDIKSESKPFIPEVRPDPTRGQ